MTTFSPDSRAILKTSMGDLTLEFLPGKAPRTCEHFVKLARRGFYDGLTFHRILKGFMVQGGCPKGDGTGSPGLTLRAEFNDTPHVKGVVSMARGNDPHSAGSQFFIVHGEARYLDSRYTAFARVVDGLEALDKIAAVPVEENKFRERSVPREPVFINSVVLEGIEFDANDRNGRDEQQGGGQHGGQQHGNQHGGQQQHQQRGEQQRGEHREERGQRDDRGQRDERGQRQPQQQSGRPPQIAESRGETHEKPFADDDDRDDDEREDHDEQAGGSAPSVPHGKQPAHAQAHADADDDDAGDAGDADSDAEAGEEDREGAAAGSAEAPAAGGKPAASGSRRKSRSRRPRRPRKAD